MKRIVAILALALFATPVLARDAAVKGTIRKNGTYVSPHHRTTPNKTRTDNYSSTPNVNPYTSKEGRVDPYAVKPPVKLLQALARSRRSKRRGGITCSCKGTLL